MKVLHAHLALATVALAIALPASGQIAGSTSIQAPVPVIASDAAAIPVPSATPSIQLLRSFRNSDVRFDLEYMVGLLRDRNHEGWVLAAYPDPKTGQPLIGAGVSIDLPAREHPQRDPLNPNPFIEPASADLWEAAGLDRQRLDQILDDFHQKLAIWDMHEYRSHIAELPSQISDDEATQLLRMAIVQSVLNAKAYCRSFDRLSASQQMALSQLVFQMGINLEEFTQFLDLINSDAVPAPAGKKFLAAEVTYWTGVQRSLIQSQWARLYRSRAISVIAMLDPRYSQNPHMAERRVGAVLRPVGHRRRGRPSTQLASDTRSAGRHGTKRAGHARKRKAWNRDRQGDPGRPEGMLASTASTQFQVDPSENQEGSAQHSGQSLFVCSSDQARCPGTVSVTLSVRQAFNRGCACAKATGESPGRARPA